MAAGTNDEGSPIAVAGSEPEGTYQRKIAPSMHSTIVCGAQQELWLARAMAAPLSAVTSGCAAMETMRNELMSVGTLLFDGDCARV
jgi:hypothetical protein